MSPQVSHASEEALNDPALVDKVSRWWQARVDRDHQVLYELYEPAYRREFTFSKFLQESAIRTRFDIVTHRLVRVESTNPDRATVFVEIGTNLSQFGGPHLVTVAEPWVKVDGDWYKVHEPFKPPFPDKPPY